MIIEIQATSSGNPPGEGGMAPACGRLWYRIDGGEWLRVTSHRSLHRVRDDVLRALDPEEQWIGAK
jgi:hypothetical protein